MAMLAVCPSCGHRNPMGRMFCMQCGASMSAARPESKPETSMAQRLGATFSRLFRLAGMLLLLFVIAMMLWPVTPEGAPGNLQDAKQLEKKFGLLKGAQLDGKTVSQRVSEVEINAHLADLVGQTRKGDSTDAFSYQMRQVNIMLEEGRVVVTVLSALGPMELSYQLTGVPAVDGRAFSFTLQQARLGHLPMPGVGGRWLAARVAVVFSGMLDERSLLDQLDRLVVGQGEVEAANVGR